MNARQSILLLTLLAMISMLIACGSSKSNTPASPAVSIAVLGGSGQSTSAGTAFATRLLAFVTTGGSPTSGVTVTFAAPTSGAGGTFTGGANSASATTDNRGVAASPVFTANMTTGAYAVTAAVSGTSTNASFNLTNTASAISVSLNPAPPSPMQPGAITTLTAVVTNDATNSGVTWSCTPLNACGSFNPVTSTGSNATTTYTAPAAIPTGGTVTITATSVQNASASASAIVTIAAAPISVSFNPVPPSSLQTGATATLTAVVANDPTNSGVTWSCAPLSACGSFNPTTSAGNTATTTYTAPAAIPMGGSVTITAASVQNASAKASAIVTITAPAAISVTLNPAPPTSLKPGATTTLTAVVANDSTNSGVTWSCTPLNACGSFNPTTSAGNTATTTYTAPTAIPTGGSVTITATAVKSTSASASANITISTSAAISVALNPAPPTSLKPGATATLTAVVTNDTTNSGVNWSCTPSNACGSFNPATSTGSTASTTYTAPTAIPSGGSVTVKATAVKSASASASANITITSSTAILADGTYAFRLTGNGNVVAGAFQVKNGAISGGEQDLISFTTISQLSDLIDGTGSSISTTADGNLQITLTTCNGKNCSSTDTSVGVNGVETLHGTMVSASRALITEFDISSTSSGSLDLQVSPVSAPAHGYAFFTSGFNNTFRARIGIGGVINVDGTASNGTIPISGTGSVFDINDGFAITQNQSFSASSVTTPDSFGRVIFTLNPSSALISPFSLVGYIVDPGHIHLVEATDTLGGLTTGEALGQGNSTGNFTSVSISGSAFVFGATGGTTTTQFQVAGVVDLNSGNTVSGILNCNDLSGTTCSQSPTATGGAYTVDATGRVTLTNLTTNAVTLQLYLSGSGTGTVVSMDTSDELAGLAYQQIAGASFSGAYGMNASGFDSSQVEFDDVGPVTAATGSLTAHAIDQNYGVQTAAVQTSGLSASGTFTQFASGVLTGTITGLDVTQNANSLTFAYYVVDPNRVIAIETDTSQWTLMNLELKH